MSPNTNRPKTERRRFRGLEVAQAALLLVLGVAVALTLYFIMMDMLQATPVPDVQLDTYHSYIAGDQAVVALKFGRSMYVVGVWIEGTTLDDFLTPNCDPQNIMVSAGYEYVFSCRLYSGKHWYPVMNVVIGNSAHGGNHAVIRLRWVVGG